MKSKVQHSLLKYREVEETSNVFNIGENVFQMHVITQQLSVHHRFYHFLHLLAVHVFINATQPLFPPHLFPSGWKIWKNQTCLSAVWEDEQELMIDSSVNHTRKETSDDNIKL